MMSTEDLLKIFPDKWIKPADGLAVTAEVWEEAHDHHRQGQRFHSILYHGSGVITGLEVMASDPPDTSVYILRGVAVDPAGQTIVLPQPVAYDVGDELEGQLYLLLSYGESRPRAAKRGQQDGLQYIHAEFSIVARSTLPATPYVELARFFRSGRTGAFLDAKDPVQPGPDEIDLRFRREVGAPREVSMAVSYLGTVGEKKQGRGALYLARALNRMGPHRLSVSDDVELGPGVETNTLIYLVGAGDFKLSSNLINGLANYVSKGRGTLFIESNDSKAEAAFLDLLGKMGMQPGLLPPGHRLLMEPYLFAAPPPGFESPDAGRVLVNDGIIFSTSNYGLLWQGEMWDGTPSREQLRSGFEWGANIIAYARVRHRRR